MISVCIGCLKSFRRQSLVQG